MGRTKHRKRRAGDGHDRWRDRILLKKVSPLLLEPRSSPSTAGRPSILVLASHSGVP
jgi:hypothetical protein